MAARRVLDELWDARRSLWEPDDRRRAADDAIWEIIHRPHSEHEYLTAQLEYAHAHMVGRDLAERAVMTVLDAPRPPKQDAEEARRLLGAVLFQYGWHRGALERTVAFVHDRQEEAARRASRAASPAARVQPAVTSPTTAPSSRRSPV